MLKSKRFIREGVILAVDGAPQPGTLKIRARPLDIDQDALNSTSFTEWGKDDPFVFVSFLPIYFNQAPKVDERVLLVYSNPNNTNFNDQYWISSSPANILNINKETYLQTLSNSNLGDNIAPAKSLVGPKSNVVGNILESGNPKLINDKIVGVFPTTTEVALMGRGSADVVVGEESLLLRAGKVLEFIPNTIPARNPNRAFIDLSRYKEKTKDVGDPYTYFYTQEDSIPVKKYVVYDIDNLESEFNYSGTIKIYDLKDSVQTLSNNLSEDTDLTDVLGNAPLFVYSFDALPKLSAVTIINTFIGKCFNDLGLVNMPPQQNYQLSGQRFPGFFCYGPKISQGIRSTDVIIQSNSDYFRNNVTYYTKKGSSKIYSPNNVVSIPKPKTEKVQNKETTKVDDTYVTIGANTLYLISHNSIVPSRGPINLNNSITTLTQKELEIIGAKTEPTVRGDELMKLIGLIVDFLISHVHNPNEEPDYGPYGDKKVTANTILEALANAKDTILNQNIRIN